MVSQQATAMTVMFGGTTQYLYGSLSNPFQVTASRAPDNVLTSYYYDDFGALYALERGGARYYVGGDHLGTPKVVTDNAGNVIRVMEYDSWGVKTGDTNPSFDLPIGFAGGIPDDATGLVRFGFRDYEPGTGRWAAKDPVLFAGGLNLFVYAGNNPVNLKDSGGLWTSSGHRDLTINAASGLSRFSGTDITLMIQSNIRVDRLTNQLNNAAHYMPGTGTVAQSIINNRLNAAVAAELSGKPGSHDIAMSMLGEGLHTLQDEFAHDYQGAGWLTHIFGNPDDPLAHPSEYGMAGDASIGYLNMFLERISRCGGR